MVGIGDKERACSLVVLTLFALSFEKVFDFGGWETFEVPAGFLFSDIILLSPMLKTIIQYNFPFNTMNWS